MGSTLTIVLLGLVLAVVQLAAGIVIGRYLPWGDRRGADLTSDPVRLQRFARRLHQMAARVASEVGEHQHQMEQANRELHALAAADGSDLAKMVLGTVAGVMKTNERLQARLTAAEDKLQRQARQIESHITEARTDSLTGLPNRRAFDDELLRRLSEWKRKRHPFCLLLGDVDYFKTLNDRYGHPAGDQVLRRLAEILKGTVREMDLVARVGGEEFAVILPSTLTSDARLATQRIRTTIAATPIRYEQTELHVTISLGLALVDRDDDHTTLLRRADEALYASKRAGRNCGHFHNGLTCEPILPDAAPPASSPPPGAIVLNGAAPTAGHDPSSAPGVEMVQLVSDLRARLAEIADQ